MEALKKQDTRELSIYFLVTYGLTYLVGFIFLFKKVQDTNMQIYLSTMFPAMGAAIAMRDRSGNKNNTRYLHDIIFAYFGISLLVFILKISGLLKNTGADDIMLLPTIIASIAIFFYTWISCPRLSPSRNIKKAALPIILALLIELFKNIIAAWDNLNITAIIFTLLYIFPSFFLCSIVYLGEEYGWRGFLQEKLQTKFGLRKGVILLGILWELWHIPFYYGWFGTTYTTPQFAAIIIIRIISTISMAIFIGWAYLRTSNIWICLLIHQIHNSISTATPISTLTPLNITLMIILSALPALVIFTKEYKRNSILPTPYTAISVSR